MKGIYLAAYEANHPNHDIVYQDINGKRDLDGDMLEIDLTPYDYIIATPPCNFWSIARGNRCSQYSLDTKHLLPAIIDKLVKLGKPFLVENVINKKRMTEHHILPRNDCKVLFIGRHTYFTNIPFSTDGIEQRQDFVYHGHTIKYADMTNLKHQGGFNVHNVVERFIQTLEKEQTK